jgi:predicted transcriptional regulator
VCSSDLTFSHRYSRVAGIDCEFKLSQEQYVGLIAEIRQNRISEKSVIEAINSKMDEWANAIRHSIDDITKDESTQVKQPRDFSKEIEDLLASTHQLTFSEIQEKLNVTAPTLSSHLEKLALQSKVERTVIGRNVVYRLKTVSE